MGQKLQILKYLSTYDNKVSDAFLGNVEKPKLHMAHPNGRVCGAKRPKCEAERSHHL